VDEFSQQSPQLEEPYVYTVVRRTWLNRRPNPSAYFVAMSTLLFLSALCFGQWNNFRDLSELWPASQEQVFQQHQYWRLWTTLFVHADLGHLAANSLLFFVFGYFLYGYFGLFIFPFLALVMGGATNALSLLTYEPTVRLVGASGIVSWMGGCWLALYFAINTKLTKTQRFLRCFGVALVLFAPSEAFDPKISHRTHAIGFVIGVICGALYYQYRKKEFKRAERRETIVS
jgi:rhomboid protease GluP